MNTLPLDKLRHDRSDFDCGIKALNDYLKIMASQQAVKDNSQTYVVEDEHHKIIGFYTLSMTVIDLSGLPSHLQKKHKSSTSAGLIARLAVDKKYKAKGIGEFLLIDALKKLLQASEYVGFPIVVVNAKSGAQQFYEKYGFMAFHDLANKLFMTISNIRANT